VQAGSSAGISDLDLFRVLRLAPVLESESVHALRDHANVQRTAVSLFQHILREANQKGGFLVVERDPRDRHAEMVRLGRALRPLGRPFDVVVVSERYAEDWGAVEGTIVHTALTEGRVLHAAA
jgi:hypothetical protein